MLLALLLLYLHIYVPQLVTADGYPELDIDNDGCSGIDVPIDLSLTIATMRSDNYDEYYIIGLPPNT